MSPSIDLGKFSFSLAVADVQKSRTFYEGLGFEAYDDHQSENWLIMKNGETTLGLFQGMFEENILSFHPSDVRAAHKAIEANGVEIMSAPQGDDGPAHMMLKDPDGNLVMLDQIDPNYVPTSQK